MSPQNKRRLCYTTALLLVLIGILWWFRSGPTELDRYKAQLLAQGEILDLDQLTATHTSRGPHGDGLTNLQLAWNVSSTSLNGHYWSRSASGQYHLGFPTKQQHTNQTDRANAWATLAAAIETNRTQLRSLNAALQNPPADRGLDYRLGLNYPYLNLGPRREIANILRTTAISDIHATLHSDAFDTQLSLLDLLDYHREEWTVVNQYLRHGTGSMISEVTWYGLASHAWNEAQLHQIQTRWERVSFLTNTYEALLFHRAGSLPIFAFARTNSAQLNQVVILNPSHPGSVGTKFWQWWNLNTDLAGDELDFLRKQQELLLIWREQIHHPALARAKAEIEDLENEHALAESSFLLPQRHPISSSISMGHRSFLTSVAIAESWRQQTISSLALERHRLKHGHYPDTLAQLIPDYLAKLPQDPMDGRPLRYRLNPDATFTLWSVGFDGKDNGGDFSMPAPKKQSFPQDARDLVWPKLDPIDLPR